MPCTRCGECCLVAYVCRISARTKESDAYEAFLASTRPKTFVRVSDGLMVKVPCEHLGKGRVCLVYENRPSVCREFLCEKAKEQIPGGHPSRSPGVASSRKDMVMNLGMIYQARESFLRFASLKMPPQMAYRLLKYLKLVDAEQAVLEQQRVKLIHDVSGTVDGENVNLAPGTPEHGRFLAQFNELLRTESDLKPFTIKMDEILAALEAEKGNVLCAADLGALEPFFIDSTAE